MPLGAAIEWFDIRGEASGDDVVASIEADRPYYTVQPGLIHKLLPVYINPDTGAILSGGAYLFDTVDHAHAFHHWVSEKFRDADGLLFHERDFVGHITAIVGEVIGFENLAPLGDDQSVKRIQLFDGITEAQARAAWPALLAKAQSAGLSALWLTYDGGTSRACLISVGRKSPSKGEPTDLDYAAIDTLKAVDFASLMGGRLIDDNCYWVFTIWLPHRPGDALTPALWPNSPPLPGPAYLTTPEALTGVAPAA